MTLTGGVVSPASKRLMAGNHIQAFYIVINKKGVEDRDKSQRERQRNVYTYKKIRSIHPFY